MDMSERELTQLFGRASRDLDARQRARIRDLKGLERDLFEALSRRVVEELDAGGGAIRTARGSASINLLVDKVFNEMDRTGLRAFYRSSVTDLFGILGNNDVFNAALAASVSKIGDKRFKAMQGEVDRIMRKRIGLDAKGKVLEGGKLDTIIRSTAMRTQVKEALNAAVQSGAPIARVVRQLEVTIKGTRSIPGVLEKTLQPLVFDEYQAFDRASNDVYAKKIGLDCFIYTGGLIETSRHFCEKRNGKVFTKEEAEKEWPNDSSLPRTTKERASGTLSGYNPIVDLGRWRCRHRTRFIPRSLAKQLRPDLPDKR